VRLLLLENEARLVVLAGFDVVLRVVRERDHRRFRRVDAGHGERDKRARKGRKVVVVEGERAVDGEGGGGKASTQRR
jgi:hypothetical protein